MKQRLSVRAIINQDNKVLVLKRANGRPSILGQFELPGGKMGYNEQPEDTLRRYLHDDVGLHIKSAQLYDAVTYIDRDDRDIQYGVLVYVVTLASENSSVRLGGNYSKYKWHLMSELHRVELTDLSELLLGIIQQKALTDHTFETIQKSSVSDTTNKSVTIFSDGGSRGNPGPSASGFIIVDSAKNVIAEGGEYLGITTNNQAEYHGVRLGLEKAIELGIKDVQFRVDSMLVVNQLKGIYKIKNRELWPIHERIRTLMTQFNTISFKHVLREYNQLADGMVNKTLDSHAREKASRQV